MNRFAPAAFLLVSLPSLAWAGFTPVDAADEVPLTDSTGVTFVDLDQDGKLDLISRDPQVWLGNGDGTFTAGPVCDPAGAPVVADFDNDGYLDVLRVNDLPVICFGNADGELVAEADAVDPSPYAGEHHLGWQLAYDAAALDLDGDGFLDLYLSNHEDHLEPDMPNTFLPFPDLFYRNDGTGHLELLAEAPTGSIYQNRGIGVGDFDDDGDPDIYVSSYRQNPNLLWQIGGSGVKEVAFDYAAEAYGHTISSTFGDVNGDGALDIIVGNLAHLNQKGVRTLINRVADTGKFEDPGDASGIYWVESFASVSLADPDNDGDLDLFIASVYAGDHGVYFRNKGDGTYEDATTEMGLLQSEGYGVAFGDVNGDGAQDVFLGGVEASHMFLGAADGTHWSRIRLHGDGVAVNTTAGGARVTAEVDGNILLREVQPGSGGGDRGANELEVHLGLGSYEGPLEVDVRWPWAETCTYAVDIDTVNDITYDPEDPACAGDGGTGGGSTGGDTDGSGTGGSGGATDGGSTDGDPTTAGSTGAETDGESSGDATGDGDGGGCSCRAAPGQGAMGLLLVMGMLGVRRRRG